MADKTGSEAEAEALRGQLDEVRDYLVAVRGGAPFLSPEDERLLLSWLDEGRSTLEIAAVIDEAAERRRKRKLRARLTLQACAKLVRPRPAAARPTAARPTAATGSLARLATTWRALALPPAERPLLDGLCTTLERIERPGAHPDELGREAAAALARFHQARWSINQHRWETLRTEARGRLQGLGLAPEELENLIEEQAHDLLRRELPDVSARRLWDTLGA